MNLSTIGSVTIVVPGLESVVVVFPTTLDSAVVTVSDVLVAGYCAAQESAFEHHGDFGVKRMLESFFPPRHLGSSRLDGKRLYSRD